MSKKITKYRLLEERLAALETLHQKDADLLSDLLNYLIRVDENFASGSGFDGWYMRLMKLQQEERTSIDCAKAKRMLEDNGYVVASDEQGLDAARVKKWVSAKSADDDIPF